MRIELGAHVWTLEGQVAGKVSKLIVNTDQQTLDSVVVHTQWMGQDFIVPIRDIARVDTDDAIHLALTEEQFRQLPQYFVAEFVAEGSSGSHPFSTPGLGASTSIGQQWDPGGAPFVSYVDMSSSVVTTQSSLSENEFDITKGTKVLAGDGSHVGHVHELSVTDEGKLRGILVTSGHIITHQHFIPIEDVADADPSAVYLRMSPADFQRLDPIDQTDVADQTEHTQP